MYTKTKTNPFHISVGAVLTNNDGDICCHHFDDSVDIVRQLGVEHLYLLIRETVEEGESLPEALHRGLREEFGAEGDISQYLGSIVSHFPYKGVDVQKTTLYFHVNCTEFDPAVRDESDPESVSEIIWMSPEELVAKMTQQAKRLDRDDLNEAEAVKRYIQYVTE